MPRVLQQRRGSTSGLASITGAAGELFVDTSIVTVVVHDGVTTGGVTLARMSDVNKINTSLTTTITDVSLNLTSSIAYVNSSLTSSIVDLSSILSRVATTTSVGLVRPNNSSIVVNNGVIGLGSSVTVNWTIKENAVGSIVFYYGGAAKFSIGSSGIITAGGDIVGFGAP